MNNYEKINEDSIYSRIKEKKGFFNYNEKKDSNTLRAKTKPIIPCSIKPISCIIPRDVYLKEIFIQLFNSSLLLNNDKKIYIQLSDEKIIERRNIIESIRNFFYNHRIKYKILYNIIYMFDILICYNNQKKLISKLEHLAIGSSILMIKFTCEEYRMIPLSKFISFYNNKNYTINQLQEIEIYCLKLLDYFMNFPTPLSFMELLLLNGVVFSTDNIRNEISLKIYNMVLLTLEKIMIISNEYIKYNPLYLCCCIVAYCRSYYEIERWPKILSKVFNVNENNFETIYKEFFEPYNHHYAKSSANLIDKLINIKLYENKYINNSKEKKEYIENNKEKNKNDININMTNNITNKVIINNQDNKLRQENNMNINSKENNNFNIKVNYKTTQEIRNSALFRKMNSKYNNRKIFKNDSNNSNIINLIHLKNEVATTIITEKKINQLNYDLLKYKSINSTKKPLINIYKTPFKFDDEDNSCFYKPNKKTIDYNLLQRKKSTITISIRNNNNGDYIPQNETSKNKDLSSNLYQETDRNVMTNSNNTNTNTNINNNDDNSINIYKKEMKTLVKKFNNRTIYEIKPKIKVNEKEEIKVKVIDFFDNSKKKEKVKRKKSYFNRFTSNESESIKNINKKIIYDNNNESKSNKNNNSCAVLIGPFNESKNTRTSIKHIENNNNNTLNTNINENKINDKKKNSINRNSSCNEKYINAYNKEEDYSNETTSDNSHNFSIRRSYFKLKKLRDKSINTNNEYKISTHNEIINDNKNNNKSNSFIKRSENNININNNNNGIKSTKFRDCLRIGFGSINRNQIKNSEKELIKDKEKEKEKDNSKSINHAKRYSRYTDIRSFYKMKNSINKNNKENEDTNEQNNKEKNNNINRNYIFH